MATQVETPAGEVFTQKVYMIDASEHYRPEGKPKEKFRVFSMTADDKVSRRVRETYVHMYANQTVDFVRRKIAEWTRFDHVEMTVMQALDKLNLVLDEADPDVDVPNIVHAFQTAERIREYHPDNEWFQLVGLIHDMGKVLALYGEPQWAVLGDTFPVGCAFAPSMVFYDTFLRTHPDLKNEVYSSKYGIYHEGIGLENVLMSWGHDEYLFQVLKNHPGCKIPEEGLYTIRLHSFYPYHTSGDYQHLCNDKDRRLLPWIKELNRFDLYTKADAMPDIAVLTPYYQSLCDKYLPGLIKF